jgi:hypothetical protein
MTDHQEHRPALAGPVQADKAGQPDPLRRSFLKAVPLGALALTAGRAQAAEAPAAVAAPAPAHSAGYRETEHIRSYYRTAAYW